MLCCLLGLWNSSVLIVLCHYHCFTSTACNICGMSTWSEWEWRQPLVAAANCCGEVWVQKWSLQAAWATPWGLSQVAVKAKFGIENVCCVCESQHSACRWKVLVVANGLLEKPSISVLNDMLCGELRPCAGTCFCFGSAHLCFFSGKWCTRRITECLFFLENQPFVGVL